jgi:hypothetical protein
MEIRVVCGSDGAPRAFHWRGRWFGIHAVLAFWVEALPWHTEAVHDRWTVQQRRVWRVEGVVTRSGALGVFDLAYDGATWVVHPCST